LISGKSLTNIPTWEERNHTIAPITTITVSRQKKIANASGNLYRRKKRKIGSKSIDIKNAISSGAITPLPTTISTPSNTIPNSSRDLRTVTGNSFIIKD
jgi:hypothetical protein